MSDKPDEKQLRWGRIGWITVLLLVCYPLSLGPLAFLAGTGWVSEPALDLLRPVYRSLVVVGHVAPPLERLLIWYDRACHSSGLSLRK